MAAAIERPIFGAELPGQAVADLEEVHGVQGGIEALIALVVGGGVTHLRAHPALVVAVDGLADEDKFRLEAVGKAAQLLEVPVGQAVGHIQPQTVDTVVLHPAADGVKLVLHHRGIGEVQLHQLLVALPGLVPQAVVMAVVAAEVDVEPVLIGAVPALLQHILEGPEATAHMVEHGVEQDADSLGVERVTDGFQILVGTQAAIHLPIVPGVVAMAVTLEKRVEQHRIGACLGDGVHPVQNPKDAMGLYAVIVLGRSAETQGVDLINRRLMIPHSELLSPCRRPRPRVRPTATRAPGRRARCVFDIVKYTQFHHARQARTLGHAPLESLLQLLQRFFLNARYIPLRVL